MEADFIKSLEQLEAKKKVIDEQSNISQEINSIVELDQRIGLLLKEIRNLKQSVEDQSNITYSTCDKLEPSYKVLQKTSELFELNQALTKLNRLCQRFDKIQISVRRLSHPNANGCRNSSIKNNNENRGDEFDEDIPVSVQIILEVADSFEKTYQPLEKILNQRDDLPYVHYAEKIKKLKESLM